MEQSSTLGKSQGGTQGTKEARKVPGSFYQPLKAFSNSGGKGLLDPRFPQQSVSYLGHLR